MHFLSVWGCLGDFTYKLQRGQFLFFPLVLLNLYIDNLSKPLKTADDLVVFSPCSSGLQQLLGICNSYGEEHDIKYNASKSALLDPYNQRE